MTQGPPPNADRTRITSDSAWCKSRSGKGLSSAGPTRPRNLSGGEGFQLTRNCAGSMVIMQPLNMHRDYIVNRKPP